MMFLHDAVGSCDIGADRYAGIAAGSRIQRPEN
jgi:hypothetical protein